MYSKPTLCPETAVYLSTQFSQMDHLVKNRLIINELTF